jgi:hypothetical protein
VQRLGYTLVAVSYVFCAAACEDASGGEDASDDAASNDATSNDEASREGQGARGAASDADGADSGTDTKLDAASADDASTGTESQRPGGQQRSGETSDASAESGGDESASSGDGDAAPGADLVGNVGGGAVSYFGSGERLSPVLLSAEKGVGTFTSLWYDAELEEACAFDIGPDGEWRCLPPTHTSVNFLDAECTQPVVAWREPCEGSHGLVPATTRFAAAAGTCGREIYRLTQPTELPAELYHRVGDGCSAFSTDPWMEADLWEAEHVSASTFVERELVVEQSERSPKMSARRWVASDGSWELESFYDTERDLPCRSLSPPGAAPGFCLPYPWATPWDGYYDAECSVLGAAPPLGEDSECWLGEPPRSIFVVDDSVQWCPPYQLSSLFEVGQRSESAGLHFEDETGDCVAAGVDRAVYPAGERIEVDSLPALERVSVGSGRIQVVFLAHDGVPYMPDGTYVDTETGEPCRARLFGDGIYRCVSSAWPGAGGAASLWSNSECSGAPLLKVVSSPLLCADGHELPVRGATVFESLTDCVSVISEVSLVTPFEGDTVFQLSNTGVCSALEMPPPDSEFFELTEALDPDEVFARIDVEGP